MSTTVLKPAGIPTLRPNADADGDCVVARLLAEEAWRADVNWPDGFEGGVAHRLDISTSGAVLVADDVAELVRIREAFRSGGLRKTYRFVTHRTVPWTDNHCQRPIAHAKRKRGRMVVQRGPNTPHRGKWWPADTRVRQVHESLWEAVIVTGVTHQIRVHAAFMGLPLAGDPKYSGGPTPDGAPEGADFLLHHVGLVGAGVATGAVALPEWAQGG